MKGRISLKEILSKYRDPKLAKKIIDKIELLASKLDRKILIMHVCGTHEWTITHYGVRDVLPENLEVRAGPGCPVCITPATDIDNMVRLSLKEGLRISTYGDMSRAKGSRGLSLEDARGLGGDIRIVYSVQDAIRLSREDAIKSVFFGVGFDTTAPSTAYMVLKGLPKNLTIYSSYRYVPPAVGFLMMSPDLEVDGFINPGHSSTVTGMASYKEYFEMNPKPMVFAGFEPIDILIAVYMILKQIHDGQPRMENEYTRSVRWEGNVKAMKTLFKVFYLEKGFWRGIGYIDNSAFNFRKKFQDIDAREIYSLEYSISDYLPKGCRCSDIIKGKALPSECPHYMKTCNPNTPIGPCMVSIEGTCRIWAEHKILTFTKGGSGEG